MVGPEASRKVMPSGHAFPELRAIILRACIQIHAWTVSTAGVAVPRDARLKGFPMNMKILLAGSAIVLATSLTATPASAQFTCELIDSGGTIDSDRGATATGASSLACGDLSNASGDGSTAVGSSAQATDIFAVAVGLGADASQANSTAIGTISFATGINSTALGAGAGATMMDSTALGQGAQAIHINSVALGTNTTTTADNQVNVGNRTISGVTGGAIAAGSTEAVNGGQINTILVNQDTRDDGQDASLVASQPEPALGLGQSDRQLMHVRARARLRLDQRVGPLLWRDRQARRRCVPRGSRNARRPRLQYQQGALRVACVLDRLPPPSRACQGHHCGRPTERRPG